MARKRRSFSASFKAQVALAAARGDKSTAELAAKFGVHSGQVTAWKKQLLRHCLRTGMWRLSSAGGEKKTTPRSLLTTR
jgi:transposase-like protein